jgi:hypothetical protein
MRTRMLLPLGITATALITLTGSLCAQESPEAGGGAKPAAPAAPAAPKSGGLDAIAKAPDPSSAIAAYAQAHADAPNDPAVDVAYVRKMVDFGLPEMAEKQARAVNERDASNGVAWAVRGFMDAKRGDLPDALKRVATAARLAPGDAFVMRTAGQLVAWYDTRADRPALGDEIAKSVEEMRKGLGGRTVYDDAYQRGRDEYSQEPDDGGTKPPAEEPKLIEPVNPPAPAEPREDQRDERYVERAAEPQTTYIYENSYVYTDPYVSDYAGYYAPATVVYTSWYPSSYGCHSYYGSSYCGPSWSWSSWYWPSWGWSSSCWPYWGCSSWYGSSWYGSSCWGGGLTIVADFGHDDFSHHDSHHGDGHHGDGHHARNGGGGRQSRGGIQDGASAPGGVATTGGSAGTRSLTQSGTLGRGSRSIPRQFGARSGSGGTTDPFQIAPRSRNGGASARGSQPRAGAQSQRNATFGAPRASRGGYNARAGSLTPPRPQRNQARPQSAPQQRPPRTTIGLPSAPRGQARPQSGSMQRPYRPQMSAPQQSRMPSRQQSFAPSRGSSRMSSPPRMSSPSRMSSPARSAPSRGGGGMARGGRMR